MRKIAIPAFAFVVGVSVGVWFISMNEFMKDNEVFSNSDTVCRTESLGTSQSACTGGSWTTWDTSTHTQTYNGFMYTYQTIRIWYTRPHQTCGYLKKDKSSLIASAACTMTKTDNGAPVTGASTENVPAE